MRGWRHRFRLCSSRKRRAAALNLPPSPTTACCSENMAYAAALKLPPSMSAGQRATLVQDALMLLDLAAAQVGGCATLQLAARQPTWAGSQATHMGWQPVSPHGLAASQPTWIGGRPQINRLWQAEAARPAQLPRACPPPAQPPAHLGFMQAMPSTSQHSTLQHPPVPPPTPACGCRPAALSGGERGAARRQRRAAQAHQHRRRAGGAAQRAVPGRTHQRAGRSRLHQHRTVSMMRRRSPARAAAGGLLH